MVNTPFFFHRNSRFWAFDKLLKPHFFSVVHMDLAAVCVCVSDAEKWHPNHRGNLDLFLQFSEEAWSKVGLYTIVYHCIPLYTIVYPYWWIVVNPSIQTHITHCNFIKIPMTIPHIQCLDHGTHRCQPLVKGSIRRY